MRTVLSIALLGFGLLAGRASQAAAQVPPELRSAEALAARVEAAELSPLAAMELEEDLDLATLDAELEKVSRYLETHPQDATALLLSVRLGRVRDLLAFQEAYMALFQDPSAGEPALPSHAPYLKALDGILARDSTVAAAHYWRARLMLEEEARQAGALSQLAAAPAVSAKGSAAAIGHLWSAVAHDPSNPAYRELLATLLVMDDRIPDAVQVLDHPSTADGLMGLLARDLLAFAPPPSAGYDPLLANFVGMVALMGAADTQRPDQAVHLELRARGWSTSAGMEEVERYYEERWPGLRFFPAEGWDGGSATAFYMADDGWRAVETREEYDAADRASEGNVILMLVPPEVYAQLRDAPSSRAIPKEMIPSGDRVGILLMNGRVGPEGSGPRR